MIASQSKRVGHPLPQVPVPYIPMPVWKIHKDLIRTGGPVRGTGAAAMPSSPGDLKSAHISPPPPPASSASSSSSNGSSPASATQSTLNPLNALQTLNGTHSPTTPSTGGGLGLSASASSTPSPPNLHPTPVSSAAAAPSAAGGGGGPGGGVHKPQTTGSTLSSSSTSQPNAAAAEITFTAASSVRQISKLKRFLTTLRQFACDISADVGDKVHALITGLVNSTITIEEFHQKIQEATHYPLRPYVIPFLRLHLPILQTEIMHFARIAKLTPAQYIRKHESLILDSGSSNPPMAAGEPFEIFQPHDPAGHKDGKRRHSPESRESRKENGYSDASDRERGAEGPPPAKRHQSLASPSIGQSISSRLSPGNGGVTPALLHTPTGHHHGSNGPSILHSHLSASRAAMFEEARESASSGSNLFHINNGSGRESAPNGRGVDHFAERYAAVAERYEKEYFGRSNGVSLYSELHRNYNEDLARDMDEEWKNIHTMLNCILGMVEKTKRALAILQHRSSEYATASLWTPPPMRGRHFVPPPLDSSHPSAEYHEIKKSRNDHLMSGLHYSKPAVAPEVDRLTAAVSDALRRPRPPPGNNHMEVVNEVKRQAVVELQKAVSAAETKASELVAVERAKMERMLSEARRQAAEDALTAINHQEDTNENCWNCGRKASETCSGCNVARYCGAFCQHKDWENHHRICGQNRENGSATNGTGVNLSSSNTNNSSAHGSEQSKRGKTSPPPNNTSPSMTPISMGSNGSRNGLMNGESRDKVSD